MKTFKVVTAKMTITGSLEDKGNQYVVTSANGLVFKLKKSDVIEVTEITSNKK